MKVSSGTARDAFTRKVAATVLAAFSVRPWYRVAPPWQIASRAHHNQLQANMGTE